MSCGVAPRCAVHKKGDAQEIKQSESEGGPLLVDFIEGTTKSIRVTFI